MDLEQSDLRGYAESRGYQLDRKESWPVSAVMRHANNEQAGHYVYFP